jgi:hypothetical protein
MGVGSGQVMKIGVDIPGHKQIDVAVAIVIAPGSAGTKAPQLHPGALGHILEPASPQVVIQHVVPIAGHIQIRQTVVVVISHGNGHTPAPRRQPGFLGDVRKVNLPPDPVLVIERDHGIAAREVAWDGGVVHHSDIELAIVVAIEQRDSAAAHRLHNVPPLRRGMRHRCQPCLPADLAKEEGRVRPRLGLTPQRMARKKVLGCPGAGLSRERGGKKRENDKTAVQRAPGACGQSPPLPPSTSPARTSHSVILPARRNAAPDPRHPGDHCTLTPSRKLLISHGLLIYPPGSSQLQPTRSSQ